ncbi:MAG: dehydrogenase [Frondihabitans sp.]|nr:dehydrogenase [Frondihabitans sp.]
MTDIALITGANKGIGFETARQLAEQGWTVLVGSRDQSRGEEAAAVLRANGLQATAIELDVSNDHSIIEAAKRIAETFDHLDVLVNNAGIYAPSTPSGTSRALLRDIFETNVFGTVAVTNAFLPLLRRSKRARIVNVSSEIASFTLITDPDSYLFGMHDMAYQTSKAAVNMITTMYAKELLVEGIKVNAAIPGYVSTDLNDYTGQISAAEGAAASVGLALVPEDGPTGTFWGTLTSSPNGDMAVAPW